jgi:CheY-like chemotaxis protein
MRNILLVEDDRAIAEMLTELLKDEGYRVVAVDDGHKALDALHVIKPDLVLSNITLPGVTGTDIARQVRADPRHHAVPIVLMSAGKAPPADFDGCTAFVAKPFDMGHLLTVVAQSLDEVEA